MIKILYIDDDIDNGISRFLSSFGYNGEEVEFDEINFKEVSSYEELLGHELVQISNIIIIDSRLFENSNGDRGNFTGEEFKLLLQKVFPFIEVILISQNEDYADIGFVTKFNSRKNEGVCSANEHYSRELTPKLNEAVKKVVVNRRLLEILKSNKNFDPLIVEQIENQIKGIIEYNDITTEDIDHLINSFNEIMKSIGNRDER